MEDKREKDKVSTACIISFTSLTIYQEDNLDVPNLPPKARWLLRAIFEKLHKRRQGSRRTISKFSCQLCLSIKDLSLTQPDESLKQY